MIYKTYYPFAENDIQNITPTNEAAQLIHSSHLPLSADNSPARRPASPLIIQLQRVFAGWCLNGDSIPYIGVSFSGSSM